MIDCDPTGNAVVLALHCPPPLCKVIVHKVVEPHMMETVPVGVPELELTLTV